MYKVDKIKNLFDCDLCHQVLVDPISIPCGNNVCKGHLDKLLKNFSKEETFFQCEICKKEHIIPESGFKVNKGLQSCLEIQLNTLKLTPIYDECKTVIKRAHERVAEIEMLEKNSEGYIYEYFEDVKRQVAIRREDLKMKIDKYSDEVIQSIESTQKNYIKISKQANQISTNIEQSKKELDSYVKIFDTFYIDEKKFEAIKQGVIDVNGKFDEIILYYNKALIGNKKYSFQFDEIPTADIFGRFYDTKYFDSVILDNSKLQSDLNILCQFPESQGWDLKYRASRDGFDAENFHIKCDGVWNTLTIIKTTNGNIFGAFAEEAWTKNTDVFDSQAFIISLINKENNPFKAMISSSRTRYCALNCISSKGPSFGHHNCDYNYNYVDISVASNSNANQSSFSCFGYAFKHQDYPIGSEKALNILAGSHTFQTIEIEVFTKKD